MRIMEAILNIYKPQGWTPLQTIDALRKLYPAYQNEKMTYAGRLDPMAEGVLLVLVGDAVHKKDTYNGLDKTYEADVLFGVGTDTHDLLGMPMIVAVGDMSDAHLKKEAHDLLGMHEYALPIYSSKPVQGKPLFQWARENRVHEITVPKRTMHVYEIDLLDRKKIIAGALRKEVAQRIGRVVGDFRQEVISREWNDLLEADSNASFHVVHIMVRCASGTYIRTLAHEWGKRSGTDAVLSRLVRTRVGKYAIGESIQFDNK